MLAGVLGSSRSLKVGVGRRWGNGDRIAGVWSGEPVGSCRCIQRGGRSNILKKKVLLRMLRSGATYGLCLFI